MGKKGKLQSSYFTFSRKSLLNKYVIATACFLVWLTFFDKNGFSTNYKLNKAINKLEISKSDYQEKLVAAKKEKKEIESNKEKYAREKFLMHREEEEVIVIEKTK